MIRVALLGSTGSIGRQTLDVIRSLPGRFNVVALAAGGNVTILEEQAREFRPRMVCCDREDDYIRGRIKDGSLNGKWATMEEMATHRDVDLVVVATVGAAGLAPTLAAARAGKKIAIANKEVLVMAGHILTAEARRSGAELRPVDSEHSAIWQCLWGEAADSVERLVITASGGALRDLRQEELERVTAEQALRHPNWQMGKKITVDSATLLNKGLECIEARWLFDVPLDRIEVLLHRESVVHSLVEFRDGSVKAQLGVPDMRLPIQCALTYPDRVPETAVPRLDLKTIGTLNFGIPHHNRFPCLGLALEAGRRGGTAPAVLAAADEIAVENFLAGYIRFTDIARVIEDTLSAHPETGNPSLEQVLEADRWARAFAGDLVRAKA
ncbi:MAG TPA: 1-deoxy-D-xylulose-5-phosphate reductoisomerase [Dehalococcoidia bacterium]|jgi:1-deoxy-D-xylulose-5-phosphate reductoisomerase|nr:1-deoxy-D-xylulose-5-phosphate reductoisomerase [Dehalococcoidia bacterium]